MKILGMFDSVRVLAAFVVVGALAGLAVRASIGGDLPWGACGLLGAVAAVAVYYVGHHLMLAVGAVQGVRAGIGRLRRR